MEGSAPGTSNPQSEVGAELVATTERLLIRGFEARDRDLEVAFSRHRSLFDHLPIDPRTDAELDANPGLVKTMSVSPPRGAGRVRLVRIGTDADQVDLQPCGGTHVARTSEIGAVRLGKIEKKGRQNRRVYIHVD